MATAAVGHWTKLDLSSFRDAAGHLRIAADVHENLAQTLLAEEQPLHALPPPSRGPGTQAAGLAGRPLADRDSADLVGRT